MTNGKLFRLQWLLMCFIGLGFMLAFNSVHAAPKPRLIINTASWSAKKNLLTVKGKFTQAPSGASIELFDINGRRLGTPALTNKGGFNLSLSGDQLAAVPCSVRASADNLENIKPVIGAPKSCVKTLGCQITQPLNGYTTAVNTPIAFNAKVKLPKKVKNPKYEWDFAGGAMGEELTNTGLVKTYQRPDSTQANVAFVRNNSHYRVRFSVVDGDASPSVGTQQYRCEDSVDIVVGDAPDVPPGVPTMAAASVASAPAKASEANGEKDDVVLLPHTDLTMQCMGDQRFTPNAYAISAWGGFNTLNAQVYRKDRLPVLLDDSAIKLSYAATTNPADPIGAGSINSTSQNWPLNSDPTQPAPLAVASIQKADWWETVAHAEDEPLVDGYFSANRMEMTNRVHGIFNPGLDEGFNVWNPPPTEDPNMPYYEGFELDWGWLGLATALPSAYVDQHGRYMPGRTDPYASNAPQDFTLYSAEESKHVARHIPITDIDDSGRVNPFPLLRVAAQDKNSGEELAKTDTVLTSGKDFHCRECHAKGKIAANPATEYSQEAFHYSAFYGSPDVPHGHDEFVQPEFFESLDRNGQPSSNLFDQEFAAARNATSLHDFYDNTNLLPRAFFQEGRLDDAGAWLNDQPNNCDSCHLSLLTSMESGRSWTRFEGKLGTDSYAPSYSQSMHLWHGQLQRDPNDANKILRDSRGVPLRWAANGSETENPRSLFPVKDAQGKSLPMEQNCLQCHAGQREQCYRDRMFTAGVTCYDCHGDMLAVGQAYPKPGGHADGLSTRVEWLDQPDCGACHTGDANQGKGGTPSYFSAGVLRRAFAADDPSATPLAPQSPRFAVQSNWTRALPLEQIRANPDEASRETWSRFWLYSLLSFDTPLFRFGKDTHGDVACAACHGGAHEVWPNRDPSANDNVTALQLQGHAGNILECNVCHTADAFKNEADLDGGKYSGDPVAGVLGGPHNLHPVNDPNWWRSASGDSANRDGSIAGGWHNNYAKKPGRSREDQCAACHGNDHRGTRLSKTPVDRVFDFNGLDYKKLKKVGIQSKVVKVAAGSEIGCDTCHNLETSCIDSPAGSACGKSSATVPPAANRPPQFTSTPVTTAVVGQPYSYQLTASDPDGDPVSFAIASHPTGSNRPDNPNLELNATTGELTIKDPLDMVVMVPALPVSPPNIVVVASDGKKAKAYQAITLNVVCPADKHWVPDLDNWAGNCVSISESEIK